MWFGWSVAIAQPAPPCEAGETPLFGCATANGPSTWFCTPAEGVLRVYVAAAGLTSAYPAVAPGNVLPWATDAFTLTRGPDAASAGWSVRWHGTGDELRVAPDGTVWRTIDRSAPATCPPIGGAVDRLLPALQPPPTLCDSLDQTVFSCVVTRCDGTGMAPDACAAVRASRPVDRFAGRVVSLCRRGDGDVTYRFGLPGAVELQFPPPGGAQCVSQWSMSGYEQWWRDTSF
ncbi:MAG: hypothetical protein ABMB14_38270, partial [Myxococcota bacterium]